MVYTLALIRHGESTLNALNVFTGWTDCDLSDLGLVQALRAGNILKSYGYTFDLAYTSVLKRAVRTLLAVLGEMDMLHIPDEKCWRLNERHYGALQGLNKQQTADKYGEDQVHQWRRGYAIRPPSLPESDVRHPRFDPRYQGSDYLPATESLEDCVARTLPFWHSDIVPALKSGRKIIVAAHGNSLRGIVKHLDSISDEDIMGVEIPVATPLIYHLDEETLKPVKSFYLGEHQVITSSNPTAAKALLAQPSSWGLLSPASPLLASWLAGLQRVGLIRPQGIMQCSDMSPVAASDETETSETTKTEEATSRGGDKTGLVAAGTPPAPATATTSSPAATMEKASVMEDVAAVLQHSRFLALDLTDATSALPPALLLGRLTKQLDPAQHTLLFITGPGSKLSKRPDDEQPECLEQVKAPVEGGAVPAEQSPGTDMLQLLEQAAAHLSPDIKVMAVQLPAPIPTPTEVTLEAAKHSKGFAADAQNTAHKDESGEKKQPEKQPPSLPPKVSSALSETAGVARVAILSPAVKPQDVQRVKLMLQYTGRPVAE